MWRACSLEILYHAAGFQPMELMSHRPPQHPHAGSCVCVSIDTHHDLPLIRTRIMLTDISRWRDADRAHGEVFRDVRPACTFVQVSGFIDPAWLVEIEADCVIEWAKPCI